ncbi:hypothetical protein [Vibrio phage PJN101]|nr:hypothetical protein [Vibrio phage PJN101]
MNSHMKQLQTLFKGIPVVTYEQYVPVAIELGYLPCHPKIFYRIRDVILGA